MAFSFFSPSPFPLNSCSALFTSWFMVHFRLSSSLFEFQSFVFYVSICMCQTMCIAIKIHNVKCHNAKLKHNINFPEFIFVCASSFGGYHQSENAQKLQRIRTIRIYYSFICRAHQCIIAKHEQVLHEQFTLSAAIRFGKYWIWHDTQITNPWSYRKRKKIL